MRTWTSSRSGGPEQLRLLESPLPAVGRDDVLVRVRAAALNPADWRVMAGTGGANFVHSSKLPVRLGFDFSGVVAAVGPGVSGFGPSSEVFGFLPYSRWTRQGSLSDFLSVPESTVAGKPGCVSHEEAAAAATVGSTALQSLVNKAIVQPGYRVLVNGAAGGVGGFAVQIARLLGAEVWATCSAEKSTWVQDLGAVRILDYRMDFLAALREEFDTIVDAACRLTFTQSRRVLRAGGTYVTLQPSPALFLGMLRSLFSTRNCCLLAVKPRQADLSRLAAWMSAGQLKCRVDANYPFVRLPEALARLHSGAAQGKVVVSLEP